MNALIQTAIAALLCTGFPIACLGQPAHYRASLKSPGGSLEFGLELDWTHEHMTAAIRNGSERIPVPQAIFDSASKKLTLGFPHYDSSIVAEWDGGSESAITGVWRKRTAGDNKWIEMPFTATPPVNDNRIADTRKPADVSGRWAVDFAGDDDPLVGVFTEKDGVVAGTFLTSTGDYRYLSGAMQNQSMTLSCFDGAHAFLFRAELDGEGKLAGDFWSSTNWHDTWTAVRDDDATLPDPLGLTTWNETVRLGDLKFPDTKGVLHSLDEQQFAGRAVVLQLFGTWCPNCDDAGNFLAALHQEYSPKGLSVVGLAFELTDEAERNARQVQRYVDRHGTRFPVLIAGLSDKARATESFRALDRVRSYPTTVFLNGRGEVRAIYTGFSGPATGDEHERLKKTFHTIIRELLADEGE